MKLYWPCAVRVDENGREESLFTSSACNSLDAAREAFKTWREGYGFKIVRCWVDIWERGEKVGHDTSIYDEATRYASQYCNREGQCWKMETPDCPFVDICRIDIENLGDHRKQLFFESSFVARYLELIGGQQDEMVLGNRAGF